MFTITQQGPIWEHTEGQWYQLASGHTLCDTCAQSWAGDNAEFEFDGFSLGYVQTGGFIEPCEPLVGDACMQCERLAHSAAARATSESVEQGARRLPIVLVLLALLSQQACAHSSSYMATTNDNTVVRCENTDYSFGSRWPLGLSITTVDECMVLRQNKDGSYYWAKIGEQPQQAKR